MLIKALKNVTEYYLNYEKSLVNYNFKINSYYNQTFLPETIKNIRTVFFLNKKMKNNYFIQNIIY